MSGIFSFIKHPMLSLLEKSDQLIQGLEKAIALYYDDNSRTLKCKALIPKNEHTPIVDYAIADLENTQKLRSRKFIFQWMSSTSLPFETESIGNKELNIFDELENVVLCVGFTNFHDQRTDLIFLYLNHNKGNFGLANSNQNLSTSDKAIIGTMASNFLNIFMKQQLNDAKTLKLVNNKVQLLQNENESLLKRLNNVSENYLASIVEMCNAHLKSISIEHGVSFSFAADAIDKLQYFNGNIDELKQSLTSSALLALNLNFGQNQEKIVLKAWDINFNKTVQNTDIINSIQIEDRYQKTFLLLNKLEKAARTVANKNLRLTSENVGHACPTPISAPAISDALKNHQKKLITLLNNHPEKWPTIRNEFRPVKNILNNSNVG